MKTLIILLCLLTASGCASQTKYGQCIGVFAKEDAHFDYKVSTRNTMLAILFWGTDIVPIMYFIEFAKCPYQVKK